VPYHFRTGTIHLFLSSYYVIPLVAVLAIALSAPDRRPSELPFDAA
jgi:hypothetical protein